MSDTTLHHIPAPGTAGLRDVGTGPNQIPALSNTPGTPNGARFLRDDGTWSAAAGDRGPEGLPNPEVQQNLGNIGSTLTIPSAATATVFRGVLTAASCTITFPAVDDGASFTLILTQGSGGGKQIVLPGNVDWPGNGGQPGLSTTAGAKDVLSFYCDADPGWLGLPAGFGYG